MKIYLASSWKNENYVKAWHQMLKERGHEVDAFCIDEDGRYVFDYTEIKDFETMIASDFLLRPEAQRAFKTDRKMIEWADAVLLILPAGRSSHLEGGYAKGLGKYLVIWQEYFPPGEFDVMYGFANMLTSSVDRVIRFFDNAEVPSPTL